MPSSVSGFASAAPIQSELANTGPADQLSRDCSELVDEGIDKATLFGITHCMNSTQRL